LIRNLGKDIRTDEFVVGKPEEIIEEKAVKPPRRKARSPTENSLSIIEKPKKLNRTVIHGHGDKVPPLLVGKGNINHHCGKCGELLAERAWPFSICNIVLQCPTCNAYNDIPSIDCKNFRRVAITKGNANISGPIILKPGVCLIGLS
jgi:hypothetical protein